MKALLFLLCLMSAWAYHPTQEQMKEFYGEKGSNHASLVDYLKMWAPLSNWSMPNAQTLRDASQGRIFFGAISNSQYLSNGDAQYRQVLSSQYSLQTAENDCKWSATEPNQEGVYTWGSCDGGSDFASSASNGAAFRGHNLCWGQSNPSWLLNGGYSTDQLKGILQDHINQAITRYNGGTKTRAYCWDVVNEAIDDNGDPNAIFKTAAPWYPAIPDYVDEAFQFARKADGSIRLFYNDYGGEGTGTKSDKIYNMVSSMKQRGIPIDGVGLQMHISCDYYPDPNGVQSNMQRLNNLGLEVQITEMDVQCPNQDFSLQANIYSAMLVACLQVKACTSFQTWGFTDRYTWVGSNNYPLPFDYNYNAKPAVQSMLDTLPNYLGITVQVWGCQSSGSANYGNQIWTWPPSPYVQIKRNGWCLDVQYPSINDGDRVWAYPCNHNSNEQWSYNSSTGELKSAASGKCLDVSGGGGGWGTPVQIYNCSGGANQKWSFSDDGTIRNGDLCLDAGSFTF